MKMMKIVNNENNEMIMNMKMNQWRNMKIM